MGIGSFARFIPPRVQWYVRGEKNRRRLYGLHAPASALSSLVPDGCLAVDVGANTGVYAYWISRSARQVLAFEPNPTVHAYLARAVPSKVKAYNVALSDTPGEATLSIPAAGSGEGTLQPTSGSSESFRVACRTLDSYKLDELGFLKVDVEGYESQVLRGGEKTLRQYRPIVFIELEERHRPNAVSSVSRYFLEDLQFKQGLFLRRGELVPIEEFDLERDQLSLEHDHMSPNYVSNFVFMP